MYLCKPVVDVNNIGFEGYHIPVWSIIEVTIEGFSSMALTRGCNSVFLVTQILTRKQASVFVFCSVFTK